jgi:hypothetical protein
MKENFPIAPAGSAPIWFSVGLGVFLLALFLLFVYIAYSSRHMTCDVSGTELRIAGGPYGRRIPLEALLLDRARVVDLTREREFELRWRTNGIGMPGYAAGWFKLRNKEKALAFVTDRRRALYLPTRQGFVLLLSLECPYELLESVRRLRP